MINYTLSGIVKNSLKCRLYHMCVWFVNLTTKKKEVIKMVKIVGYERKVGIFENTSYDNHVIYLIDDSDSKIIGFGVGQVKIKTEQLQDVFGTTELNSFLNKTVKLEYSIKNTSAVLVKVELAKD